MAWKDIKEGLEVLLITFVASILMILLGIVYFGVTLWVIKTSSNFFFGPGLTANWAVLSAALMAVGGILAGALEMKHKKK